MWNRSQYLNLRCLTKHLSWIKANKLKKTSCKLKRRKGVKNHRRTVGGFVLNILMQFQLWVVVNILFQNPCRIVHLCLCRPMRPIEIGYPSTVTLLSAPSWAFFLPCCTQQRSHLAPGISSEQSLKNQPNDDSTCWSFHTRHKYVVSYLNITYILVVQYLQVPWSI